MIRWCVFTRINRQSEKFPTLDHQFSSCPYLYWPRLALPSTFLSIWNLLFLDLHNYTIITLPYTLSCFHPVLSCSLYYTSFHLFDIAYNTVDSNVVRPPQEKESRKQFSSSRKLMNLFTRRSFFVWAAISASMRSFLIPIHKLLCPISFAISFCSVSSKSSFSWKKWIKIGTHWVHVATVDL